ncbi:MAG: metal ABC transporter substrate-binding protein [Anaerolineales bacterium]
MNLVSRFRAQQRTWRGRHWFSLLVAFLLMTMPALTSCSGSISVEDQEDRAPALGQYAVSAEKLPALELSEGERLKVVATTTLVADIAGRVGGDLIDLSTILPYGADPHGYSATPQDLRRVSQADVVLSAGFDLEATLLQSLASSVPDTPILSLSEGAESRGLIEFEGSAETADTDDEAHLESDPHHEGEHGFDPHVWFDPMMVDLWAENAARSFARLDPDHEQAYQENLSALSQELLELDRWIQGQVAAVPEDQRELVTDHLALTYFAERYDFELVGAVIPAYSTTAEASAQELAELQELISEREVAALFVGATADPGLTERIAADLGIPVVKLHTGSLTPPGGEASNYFEFMRFNVGAIVEALS